MIVRGLAPGDTDRLWALDALCFEQPFLFSRQAMRRFALAENALVRLVVDPASRGSGEVLLGFCIVHLEPSPPGLAGYVVTLDVHPEARGRGIATLLMTALEELAAQAGASAMALHVFHGNAAAISLYKRLGYRSVKTVADFYGPGLDAFAYERVLEDVELARGKAGAGGGATEAL